MGVFQLPQTLCKELSAMIARFWWGKSNQRGIHWMGWRMLCQPKCMGGLGLKNFEAFNKALVAKQAWRILEKPNSLVPKILKARYFPHGHFMGVPPGKWFSPKFASDVANIIRMPVMLCGVVSSVSRSGGVRVLLGILKLVEALLQIYLIQLLELAHRSTWRGLFVVCGSYSRQVMICCMGNWFLV
ncbi:hypothetical protein GBA52_002670 [Prunus armeniaca]|nr:hypothetical protein GBA52_002670 [Prunus armeniaca]